MIYPRLIIRLTLSGQSMQIMSLIWQFIIPTLLLLSGSDSYCVGGRSSASCSGWGPANLNSGANLNLSIPPNFNPISRVNQGLSSSTRTTNTSTFAGNPHITSLRIEGRWWTPTWSVVDSFFPNLEVTEVISMNSTQSLNAILSFIIL